MERRPCSGASRSRPNGLLRARVEGRAMVPNVVAIVAGAIVILLALNDVFQSVVVPRAAGRAWRVSFVVWSAVWSFWPRIAFRLFPRDADRCENFLADFAPFTLVLLLAVWTACALLGYALIFWGLRDGMRPSLHTFGDALYFSGTSLFTLGFGDLVGRTGAPRAMSVLEALTGLGILSIVTAYLFAIFAAFQTRESFVVTVSARTSLPPSGINLLTVAAYADTRAHFDTLMLDAQRWCAALMESHLAYPVLAFFRSNHDCQSWVGTLGSLLDAALLVMTTVDGEPVGEARIFYTLGRHATRDLARHFRVTSHAPGIERSEFERACDRLARAGYTLRDRDAAWSHFSELRRAYAPNLNALAHFFRTPPLQWIGDRNAANR